MCELKGWKRKLPVQIFLFMLLSLSLLFHWELRAQAPWSKTVRRSVNLEWQEIDGAWKYELELTPIKDGTLQNKRILTFKTSKTYWDGYIAPGLYSMRLRSLDWRGVPGEWSQPENVTIRHQKIGYLSPTNNQVILSEDDTKESVTFSWTGFPGAESFQLSVWSKDKTLSKTQETAETEFKIELPVAQDYSWTVHPIKVKGVESDPNEDVLDFSITGKALTPVSINPPENEFVRELSWEETPLASNYSLQLERFNKTSNQWTEHFQGQQTQTKLVFNPEWPGGLYRLSVVASGVKRQASPASVLEFKVRNGNRSEEAQRRYGIQLARRRTNHWFFIASYLLTQIKYESKNYDSQNDTSGNNIGAYALGGTGRLGLGYLGERKPWGFLGIIDNSGFKLENKIYTYPALEALAIYRATSTYNTEVRVSAGTYYKEVPEILYDKSVTKLTMFGPVTGVEALLQFNEKWGAQMNAKIYMPISGTTPKGKPLIPTPSYQAGMMGSLRLRPNAWGHAGLAYRKDAFSYKASKTAATSSNETTISGTYLNFYLEWTL